VASVRTRAPDIADGVTDRLALARFSEAARAAVDCGDLSASVWSAYRDHRLRRAVDSSCPTSTGVQRKLASRAATRIRPLVDQYLHAA
jgi:hypothetical protein